MRTARTIARTQFLQKHALQEAALIALPQDASFRRYYRVATVSKTMLLMDAPPPQESISQFTKVSALLHRCGARVPKIFAEAPDQGFLLIEDLGVNTFTQLLQSGENEEALYKSDYKHCLLCSQVAEFY